MKENKKNKEEKIGTIRKKGKSLEGRVYVKIDGVLTQKSVYGKTEREVNDKMKALKRLYEKKEQEKENQQEELTSTISTEITVEEWIKIWIRDYKRPFLAQSTINGYIEKINAYIMPVLKERSLLSITKRDIQLLMNGLINRKKKLAHKTRKETLGICRMIFQSAIDDVGILEKNPALGINIGKKDPPKKKNIMSIEEQLEVMQILMSEYNGIAFFALFTLGVRASELAGFLWKDLDDICDNITVDRGFQVLDIYDDDLKKVGIERKYTELKSYTSHRDIPVISILKNELLKYKKQIMQNLNITDESELDNEAIFRTKIGNISADYLRQRLRDILEKYNFRKVTVHELRHTFATRCLESGIGMKTLQILLGHADYSTTANIYAHVLENRKNMEILKYNKYMTDTFKQNFNNIVELTNNIENKDLRNKTVVNMQNSLKEMSKNKNTAYNNSNKNNKVRYTRKLTLKLACCV